MKNIYNKNSALIEAVKTGNLKLIDHIIGTIPDAKPNKDSILILASRYGDISVVKHIIETHGANIHANTDMAFRTAAIYNRLDIVKYFVEQGADIHACNDEAINFAYISGHYEMLMYLKSLK